MHPHACKLPLQFILLLSHYWIVFLLNSQTSDNAIETSDSVDDFKANYEGEMSIKLLISVWYCEVVSL